MAVSLCSDWGTVERAMVMNNIDINGAFHQQYPPPATVHFGFFGTSPSSLDTSDLPLLEHLFNGSPNPDHYLLQDPSSDPHQGHHFSSLLSSNPAPSDNAFLPNLCLVDGEFGTHGPSSLLLSANALGDAPSCLEPQFLSEYALSSTMENPEAMSPLLPQVPAVMGFSGTGGYTGQRILASGVGGGGGSPSAQSVAARQRRKRITEKTHELGQLVPGGSRMNTAEMLQAAFKYVKFLQAQVGMLDLMRSLQPISRGEEIDGSQLLQALLLASPAVQEKLASEERCMVPACMVRALMEDKEIKSHPSIFRDLHGQLHLVDGLIN